MSFPMTPKWAADKHFLWHSNPENVPLCKTFFEKCVVRPKTQAAWKVLKKEIKGQFIMFEYEFLLKQQRFSKKIHQSSLYKGIDDISNDDRINIFYDYKNPARNVWEFE